MLLRAVAVDILSGFADADAVPLAVAAVCVSCTDRSGAWGAFGVQRTADFAFAMGASTIAAALCVALRRHGNVRNAVSVPGTALLVTAEGVTGADCLNALTTGNILSGEFGVGANV